jgi:hypothetical protein
VTKRPRTTAALTLKAAATTTTISNADKVACILAGQAAALLAVFHLLFLKDLDFHSDGDSPKFIYLWHVVAALLGAAIMVRINQPTSPAACNTTTPHRQSLVARLCLVPQPSCPAEGLRWVGFVIR